MNNHISIVHKGELAEILKLQYEAFGRVAKEINNHDLPSLKQTEQQLQEEFPSCTMLKYCMDGRMVGSIRGKLDDAGVCHVGALIVATGFQNQGIGRALMEAIEKQFPDCEKYALFTSMNTPNTSYLYKKLGYKEVSRRKLNGIDMIFMEKNRKSDT